MIVQERDTDRRFTTVTEKSGKFYFISTVDKFDSGWETLVFECDRNGNVRDWNKPVDSDRHNNKEDAKVAHEEYVNKYAE